MIQKGVHISSCLRYLLPIAPLSSYSHIYFAESFLKIFLAVSTCLSSFLIKGKIAYFIGATLKLNLITFLVSFCQFELVYSSSSYASIIATNIALPSPSAVSTICGIYLLPVIGSEYCMSIPECFW